jgi:hypothetical protein
MRNIGESASGRPLEFSEHYIQYKLRLKTASIFSWTLLAYAYNLSYLGGQAQEDCGSKPAQTNCSGDPHLKKTLHEKGLVEWFKV